MRARRLVIAMAMLFGLSCITQPSSKPADDPDTAVRIDRGVVANTAITEASGLAASRINPGVLWTHNDSGGQARIFAVGTDGADIGCYDLAGVTARDWEDIAIGPGPVSGASYLYIGDIGSLNGLDDMVVVHRVPEPLITTAGGGAPVEGVLDGVETLTFVYPGKGGDAETLMVDPLTRDIYIATKRKNRADIYRAAFPQSVAEPDTMALVAAVPLEYATAGDISPDGAAVLIKNAGTILCWRRPPGGTLAETFAKDPSEAPYVAEHQGEGLCWDAEGAGYYTISEQKKDQPVHLYYYAWPAVE